MIQIICGEKGTGKTKTIISLANGISEKAKGSMVFIDDDNSYMYDLGYSIRFINVTDYALIDPDMFLGFLCGLCASDFDLEYVFIGIIHFTFNTILTLLPNIIIYIRIRKNNRKPNHNVYIDISKLIKKVGEIV